MKSWPILALVLTAGCSGSSDNFHVYDEANRVRTATVELCGRTTAMPRHGEYFFVGVPITCEGQGAIVLSYRDGSQAQCPIGYVTDAHQEFNFRAGAAGCDPISPSPGA